MLSKYEKERINKELKGIVDEYKRSYETMRTASEAKYKTTLQPGATFHPRSGFYYDEDRQAFNAVCDRLKEKAHDLVNKATLEVMEKNLTAPSTEAVNMVTLLNARQNVSAEEIDQLMTKYGLDCPMVYKALHEKARSLGYHDFKPHPIAEEAENIEAMTRAIDSAISSNRAENSIVTSTAALSATIDQAFSIGE